ncbi:exonuclease 3'-5' domain-containing protein 2-like [Gigantopelta aegis]|uniref:exonuclease 3'-5' domain-containing protein 2-like n=1 Tax=Gigantopelta aegis TaxID=1735272 RepID=UPI001B88D647|nr:exonuclease 3'-5' domain-containing protein 2-like [Gigantopelta aegis]
MNKTTKRIAVVAPIMLLGGVLVWHLARRFFFSKKKLKFRRTDGSIHLVTSSEEWEIFYPQLMSDIQNMKVVGFDTEWVHSGGHRHPVALLQIASYRGLCALVRLCYMQNDIPSSLAAFLSDRSILKVGVGVSEDGQKLLKDYQLPVRGGVDLRNLLVRVRDVFHCPNQSLQGLCDGVLGQSLDKQHAVRCGNWEAHTLSTEQVEYSAADAMVAVDIFVRLVLGKLLGRTQRNNQPLSGWHKSSDDSFSEYEYHENPDMVSESQFWQTATSLCQGLVDSTVRISKNHYSDSRKSPDKRPEKVDMLRAYSIRQRPLYDNCQLMAPDGQMLCTCNASKAQWYIMKGLGEKVSDDPIVVKLRFEPSGRPESDRNYYLQDKQNVCVVCGASDSYIRKFIVPQEYRKYFPPSLKDHRSHDILLLCPPCHQLSAQHDSVLRLQLADECSAPLDSGLGCKSRQDHGLQIVKSSAKALKFSNQKIPEQRKDELRKIILDHFGAASITDDLLETACSIDVRIFNDDYVSHGQKVVNQYKCEHGLEYLEKRWRQHFVDMMKPRYLPNMWSVDHENSGMVKSDLENHRNKMKCEQPSTSTRT